MPLPAVHDYSFAKPWENLRHTLASTARFRQLVSGDDENPASVDAAKDAIFYFWCEADDLDDMLAIVRGIDDDESTRLSSTEYQTVGPISLAFELPVPALYESDHQAAGLSFLNDVGTIRRQMQDLAIADPSQYLNIEKVALAAHGEANPRKNNRRRYWGGELIVSWEGM